MNDKDMMKKWFKELPLLEPNSDFTAKVMQNVMNQWMANPAKYQPIISKKGWSVMGAISIVFTLMLLSIYWTLNPESTINESNNIPFEFSKLFEPITHLLLQLGTLPPAITVGVLTITALWFFDQLLSVTFRR